MKKRQFSAGVAVMLVLLAVVATFNITFYLAGEYYNKRLGDIEALEKKYSKFQEISGVVQKYFVGEYDEQAAMDGAMAGYIGGLGDKWSSYYDAEQTAAIKESRDNTYVGIGVTISLLPEEPFSITNVYKDGPAFNAGVQPFDIITHVDGKSVDEFETTDDVVSAVRGQEGTKVRITVDRKGSSMDFDITRGAVYNEQVEARMLDGGIGYISIAGFEKNVDVEFKEKLDGLVQQDIKGIVFDVRMNPGGYLPVMVNILDLLLPEGDVITMVDSSGYEVPYKSDDKALGLPMIVIVNKYSISAAEFFAMALQEYGVALIVGENTGGKGFAQQMFFFDDGTSLNLSVNRYYTPKGKSLIGVGVVPDFAVELTEEQLYNFYYMTDEEDPQLQKAITELAVKIGETSGADGGDPAVPDTTGETESTTATVPQTSAQTTAPGTN